MSMPMSISPKKANPKLIGFLLLLVFLGPFGFAINMHKKADQAALRHNNVGELITPVKQARDLFLTSLDTQQSFKGDKLAGKWQFMYIPPLACDEACHESIAMMGQIHHSLNKSATRLERMLVLLDFHKIEDFKTYNKKYSLRTESYSQTLGSIGDKAKRDEVGEFYIIDPKGHIMMYYTGNTPPKGILKDLNKLMKASKIG